MPTASTAIIGRRDPIVSGDVAHTPSFELVVPHRRPTTSASRPAPPLGNGVPVLLRTPPENGIGNLYFAVTGFCRAAHRRPATEPARRFVVAGVQVDRPDPALYVPLAAGHLRLRQGHLRHLRRPRGRARELRRARLRLGRRERPRTSSPGPRATYETRSRPLPGLACARRTCHRLALPRCYFPGEPSRSSVPRRGRRGARSTAPPRAAARGTIADPLVAGRPAIDRRPGSAHPAAGRATPRSSAACATPTASSELVAARPAAGRVRQLGDARPGRLARARRPHGPGPRRALHRALRRRRDAARPTRPIAIVQQVFGGRHHLSPSPTTRPSPWPTSSTPASAPRR